MKKFLFTTVFIMLIAFAIAQAPQGISHQAVIRNAANELVISSPIGIKVSILQGSAEGSVVYSETHLPISNASGLISFVIGQGTVASGVFAEIDWADGPYFIQNEADPEGGDNYSISGTTQLLSVPYSLFSDYSAVSATLQGGQNTGEMLFWDGEAWVAVESGSTGQTLSFCNGVPLWGPCLPVVSTAEVTGITYNSATSGGNVSDDRGLEVNSRGVVWSTSQNPDLENHDGITEDGTGTGEFVSDLTGLTQLTTYYVRAYATNDAGTAYGDEHTFTTLFNCGDLLADDRDGNQYVTVQIGDQCWMAENLAYLPTVNPSNEGSESDPYYYVYDYQGSDVEIAKTTANYQNYGVLYNWTASLGACPFGWRLPNNTEWKLLEGAVDSQYGVGDPIWDQPGWRGFDVGKNLKSTSGWISGNGTNLYDFNAFAGGTRIPGGTFNDLTRHGGWWSSAEYPPSSACFRRLSYNSDLSGRFCNPKAYAFSVRCLLGETSLVSGPAVITAAVTDITSSSAISGGEVIDDGDNPVTERGLVWSTTENPTLDDNMGFSSDGTGIGEFTSNMTGLAPATTYYVRAYATNSLGTAYGEELSFTTLEGGFICGTSTITDIDGNIYNTVQIGDQCWMKENLKTTKYRNNTLIDYPGNDAGAWEDNTSGAYAWYNNDFGWKDTYGALYNWYAVSNINDLCPEGWHVPADAEWTQLTDYLGGLDCGGMLKEAGTAHWMSPNGGATNITGFTALPGGYRNWTGPFTNIGYYGYWWSSTDDGQINSFYARNRYLYYWNTSVFSNTLFDKRFGFSIRCIRND